MKYILASIITIIIIGVLIFNVPIGIKVLDFRSVTSKDIPINTDYIGKDLTEELENTKFIIHSDTLYLKVYERTPYLLWTSIKTFDWSEKKLKRLTSENSNIIHYLPIKNNSCYGVEWICENSKIN